MPPSTSAAMQTSSARLLTQTAVVYTEDPSTGPTGGRYTVVNQRALACRLVRPGTGGATSTGARAEMMAGRDLWFDPTVALPEQCRLVIDGITWTPIAGTFQAIKPDGTTVVARRCMAIRIQSASF